MKEEIKKYLLEKFIIKNNEIKKNDGTRKIWSDVDVIKELGNYSDDNDLDWSKSERTTAVNEWKKLIEDIKNKPQQNFVVKYIVETFRDNNIKILPNRQFTRDGIIVNECEINTKLEAGVYDWNRANQNEKISVPELKSALEDIKTDTFFSSRKKVIESISYDYECEPYLDDFLKLSHKTFDIAESYDVYSTLMKHFMWMVKRRITNKETVNQIMLNFFGAGGVGKTYFIKLFTEPFSIFRVMNAKIETVQDERRIKELSDNFIHFIDELSGEKKVYQDQELGVFKQVITADSPLTYRQLGSHVTHTVYSRTSLIACSNFHIFDTIMDSSGMRRFFEFNIRIKTNGYNVDEMNKLKSLCLNAWKGINEDLDDGYWIVNSEIGKEIRTVQDSYVRKESFELWLESVDITEDDKGTPGNDVYSLYQNFCEEESLDHKKKSIQTFYSRLDSLGYKRTMTHGKTFIRAKFTKKSHDNYDDFMNKLNELEKKQNNKGIE